MLFRLWSPKVHRPTKDLDLLGLGSPDRERVARLFAEIASVVVDDDGMVFDPKSVKASRIKEDAEYEGVRVNVTARIGSARLELQIDVEFGDVVTPGTIDVDFPTLLPMAAPKLRAYPKETVVAEKLQAMVFLGIASPTSFCPYRIQLGGPLSVAPIARERDRRSVPREARWRGGLRLRGRRRRGRRHTRVDV